jgi:hypothetical protein
VLGAIVEVGEGTLEGAMRCGARGFALTVLGAVALGGCGGGGQSITGSFFPSPTERAEAAVLRYAQQVYRSRGVTNAYCGLRELARSGGIYTCTLKTAKGGTPPSTWQFFVGTETALPYSPGELRGLSGSVNAK